MKPIVGRRNEDATSLHLCIEPGHRKREGHHDGNKMETDWVSVVWHVISAFGSPGGMQ